MFWSSICVYTSMSKAACICAGACKGGHAVLLGSWSGARISVYQPCRSNDKTNLGFSDPSVWNILLLSLHTVTTCKAVLGHTSFVNASSVSRLPFSPPLFLPLSSFLFKVCKLCFCFVCVCCFTLNFLLGGDMHYRNALLFCSRICGHAVRHSR